MLRMRDDDREVLRRGESDAVEDGDAVRALLDHRPGERGRIELGEVVRLERQLAVSALRPCRPDNRCRRGLEGGDLDRELTGILDVDVSEARDAAGLKRAAEAVLLVLRWRRHTAASRRHQSSRQDQQRETPRVHMTRLYQDRIEIPERPSGTERAIDRIRRRRAAAV